MLAPHPRWVRSFLGGINLELSLLSFVQYPLKLVFRYRMLLISPNCYLSYYLDYLLHHPYTCTFPERTSWLPDSLAPLGLAQSANLQPIKLIPLSNAPNMTTLTEIQRECLTKIAAANWLKSSSDHPKKPFSPDLVNEIYQTELLVKSGGKPVPLQRVMILEDSQYSENYLWPSFHPETASFEHVMSMILMINEKFRENVEAWVCFHDRKDMFKAFLERVLCLKDQVNLVDVGYNMMFLGND